MPDLFWEPDLQRRYEAAIHAVQSGVELEMTRGFQDTSPKHLRVGVNSALVECSALTRLLLTKKVFTAREFQEKLVQVMEEEQQLYENRNGVKLG